MSICHITSVHPRYDIRIFVKECQALANNYQQVSLIVADSLGNENKDNIHIYDVGKSSGGRWQRMFKTSRLIFAKVCELQPTIIHFHDPELIGIGIRLAKLGYKVIYDVHEDVPKQILNKAWLPKLLRPTIAKIMMLRERHASSYFAGIICATELIAQRFLIYNPQTKVVHNYPLLSELQQINVAWQQRNDNLCYIGSISQTRGIIPLINSLAESKLNLDLAGIYSDETIKNMVNQSVGIELVNYHGILSRLEISKLLSSVKVGMVTLLPTPSYIEALPIKLFEYMLAGIPVVASNFPLWEMIIKRHNCGLLVDPQDSHAIAQACLWLINNPQQASQLGENGKQAVLKYYNWEHEQSLLLDFYESIINN
jgi:glycosyltransferase involved in cell wall biosynthesis